MLQLNPFYCWKLWLASTIAWHVTRPESLDTSPFITLAQKAPSPRLRLAAVWESHRLKGRGRDSPLKALCFLRLKEAQSTHLDSVVYIGTVHINSQDSTSCTEVKREVRRAGVQLLQLQGQHVSHRAGHTETGCHISELLRTHLGLREREEKA